LQYIRFTDINICIYLYVCMSDLKTKNYE